MALLTRRQLRLLLPLGAALALSLTGDSTLYAVLPNQLAVVGISLGAVGLMLGANRLVRIPGNLVAGALYDRQGRRRLFLAGLALGILSTLSYSIAHGFWPLLAARLLWGLAWSLINVGGYTMVLDWSTPADRGRLTGFYQVSYLVGLSISPILGGLLTDTLGFAPAVRICAAVSAVGLAVAWIALPETSPPAGARGQQRSAVLAEAPAAGRPDRSVQPCPRRALPAGQHTGLRWLRAARRGLGTVDRHLLLVGYVYLVVFFVSNGVLMSTLSFYLGQRWGTEIAVGSVVIGVSSLAGLTLALRAAVGILGGPVAGILSDRLGNRWPVARVAIVMGVVGFVAVALVADVRAVPVGVALVSLSAGSLVTVLTAIVGDLSGLGRSGRTMGGLATAGDLGSALGPLLAYGAAAVWDLRWIYRFCAAALASCLLATLGAKSGSQSTGS